MGSFDQLRQMPGAGEESCLAVYFPRVSSAQADRGCKEARQVRPPDHRHVPGIAKAGLEVVADQQAARISRSILARRLAEQHPGADREEFGGEIVMAMTVAHAGLERGVGL